MFYICVYDLLENKYKNEHLNNKIDLDRYRSIMLFKWSLLFAYFVICSVLATITCQLCRNAHTHSKKRYVILPVKYSSLAI